MDNKGKPLPNLRDRGLPGSGGCFFTCGRPGYCASNKNSLVPSDLVSVWVSALPGDNKAIVSLLGRKPGTGKSEFIFYPFYGVWDSPEERGDRLSWQEWLNQNHGELDIVVKEHSTWDKGIPDEQLAAIAKDVFELMSEGRTVTVVDSAGLSRTNQVANYIRRLSYRLTKSNVPNRRKS